MAMRVAYTVLNGRVFSENRGGTKRDYVSDSLGSTVALLDNTQTKTDTLTYWPFGEVRTRTGTTATPFQFVGTWGYYCDSAQRTYVQARYLAMWAGRWLTQDPTGFPAGAWNTYQYVSCNPVSNVDPDGRRQHKPGKSPGLPEKMTKECLSKRAQDLLIKKLKDQKCADAIKKACNQGGLDAISNPKIIPEWKFPEDCGKGYRYGRCRMFVEPKPNETLPQPGDPCHVDYVCISQAACKAGPDRSACLIIFELGNACQCVNKGYQPSEGTAQTLANACGCSGFVKPGGVLTGPT